VTATCQPRHRHKEFLRVLRQVARAYLDRDPHVEMDNHAAHKHPAVRRVSADSQCQRRRKFMATTAD
jgi:hypothetical protein